MKYFGHKKLLCKLSKFKKNTKASTKHSPERTGFNMYAENTQQPLNFLALLPCFRGCLVSPVFCYLEIDTSISILIKYSEQLVQKLFSRLTLDTRTFRKYYCYATSPPYQYFLMFVLYSNIFKSLKFRRFFLLILKIILKSNSFRANVQFNPVLRRQ